MSVMFSGVSCPPSACAKIGIAIPGLISVACDSHWIIQSSLPAGAAAFAAFCWSLNGPSVEYFPRLGAPGSVEGVPGVKLWHEVQYETVSCLPRSTGSLLWIAGFGG